MFKSGKFRSDSAATDTFIGQGSVFEGRLVSDGGIRIEGRVTGSVHSKGDVSVGEHGVVEADIQARNIIIAGTVNGNVRASEKTTIRSKGRLIGDIVTALLEINEGAYYEGTSRMQPASGASAAQGRDGGTKADGDTREAHPRPQEQRQEKRTG